LADKSSQVLSKEIKCRKINSFQQLLNNTLTFQLAWLSIDFKYGAGANNLISPKKLPQNIKYQRPKNTF